MSLPTLPSPQVAYAKCSWAYTAEQMQSYGQQCRAAGLEEAVSAIEDANARRIVYLPDAIEIIRSLK